jgi:hypothetical protein
VEKSRSLAQHKIEVAVKRMSPALEERCRVVRSLLSEARRGGASARYQVGSIVRDIKQDPQRYGEAGVKLLAASIGRDEDSLYLYAAVAEMWTLVELEELTARRGLHGLPPSFSHFMTLTRVRDRVEREALIERCLEEGLSVRDLKKLVDFGKRPRPTRDLIVASSESPPVILAQMLKTTSSVIGRAADWNDGLGALSDLRSTPKLARMLRDVTEHGTRLREILGFTLERLGSELQRVQCELSVRQARAPVSLEDSHSVSQRGGARHGGLHERLVP